MLLLAGVMDVAWVTYQSQPGGIYSKFITGKLDRIHITIIWLVLLMLQVLLLYLLTEFRQDQRLIMGALQGFTVYSVFNLTSKVVFPDSSWPWSIVVKDILWGTLLYGMIAHMVPIRTANFDPAVMHPATLY